MLYLAATGRTGSRKASSVTKGDASHIGNTMAKILRVYICRQYNEIVALIEYMDNKKLLYIEIHCL
jgi:hypothetical protein